MSIQDHIRLSSIDVVQGHESRTHTVVVMAEKTPVLVHCHFNCLKLELTILPLANLLDVAADDKVVCEMKLRVFSKRDSSGPVEGCPRGPAPCGAGIACGVRHRYILEALGSSFGFAQLDKPSTAVHLLRTCFGILAKYTLLIGDHLWSMLTT